MAFTKLHTPKGTRDYLPSEVERCRHIEEGLRKNFELWGYQEIRSSTIEFIETLSTGVGSELVDNMFKFQDFDGKIVALKAEMTAPVARIVANRMSSFPQPIRLFYVSNLFRYSQSYIEREREFWQAGVELVGCDTPEADGEILALLVSSLKKMGLEEVRVDMGHANLLKDLIKATGLNKKKRRVLQDLLGFRDEARLEEFMNQNKVSSEIVEAFLQLSSCRRLDEVSSSSFASSKLRKAEDHLRNLQEIRDVLADYGIKDFVFFDCSLTRRIGYYTGIVFEVSVPNMGLPLGGGGRYDDFIEKFGKLKIPATGFALEIGKCLQALTAQGFQQTRNEKARILVASRSMKAAMKVVESLRNVGVVTLLDVTKNDEDKILMYGDLSGLDYVVFVNPCLEKLSTVCDVRSGGSRKMKVETFLKSFRRLIT